MLFSKENIQSNLEIKYTKNQMTKKYIETLQHYVLTNTCLSIKRKQRATNVA